MKHFLLFYDVADDYVAKRADFRGAHLEKAWASHARGELLLGGALVDPIDGAVLLFKGDSRDVAESFAKTDPYVVNGLVRSWKSPRVGYCRRRPGRESYSASGLTFRRRLDVG